MRSPALLFAVLLALMPLASASPVDAGVHQDIRPFPHPAIVIEGDGAFDGPLSGVVRGSGSIDDPYVIEGWMIVGSKSAAIRITNTTAHVLVNDILVASWAEDAVNVAECIAFALDCDGSAAMRIVNASNVTVKHMDIPRSNYGFVVLQSKDVSIRDVSIGMADPLDGQIGDAIFVRKSENVEVVHAAIRGADVGLNIQESSHVAVRNSTISAISNSYVRSTDNLTLAANDFVGRGVLVAGTLASFSIVGNRFHATDRGIAFDDFSMSIEGGLVCGNTFVGLKVVPAIHLRNPTDLHVVGNVFKDVDQAMVLSASSAVRVEGNLVENTSAAAAGVVISGNATVRTNSFVDIGLRVTLSGEIDARGNWWDSADGPSGDGPGNGTTLRAIGNVAISPWLSSAPAVGSCLPAFGPSGASPSPTTARATVQGEARSYVRAFGSLQVPPPLEIPDPPFQQDLHDRRLPRGAQPPARNKAQESSFRRCFL